MAKKKEEQASIESQLEALQALVARMESGELSLDETLAAFEQGVKLTREAQASLAEAEQKIQLLTADSDEPSTEPFGADED